MQVLAAYDETCAERDESRQLAEQLSSELSRLRDELRSLQSARLLLPDGSPATRSRTASPAEMDYKETKELLERELDRVRADALQIRDQMQAEIDVCQRILSSAGSLHSL